MPTNSHKLMGSFTASTEKKLIRTVLQMGYKKVNRKKSSAGVKKHIIILLFFFKISLLSAMLPSCCVISLGYGRGKPELQTGLPLSFFLRQEAYMLQTAGCLSKGFDVPAPDNDLLQGGHCIDESLAVQLKLCELNQVILYKIFVVGIIFKSHSPLISLSHLLEIRFRAAYRFRPNCICRVRRNGRNRLCHLAVIFSGDNCQQKIKRLLLMLAGVNNAKALS